MIDRKCHGWLLTTAGCCMKPRVTDKSHYGTDAGMGSVFETGRLQFGVQVLRWSRNMAVAIPLIHQCDSAHTGR